MVKIPLGIWAWGRLMKGPASSGVYSLGGFFFDFFAFYFLALMCYYGRR